MFKSVMFIYGSHYNSVSASSGKTPSILRVLSSLQKLLQSQENDGRLNIQFPITVTVWEQLFAKACQQLSKALWNRECKKWGMEGGKDEREVSGLIQSSQGFKYCSHQPADICVETHAQTLNSTCGENPISRDKHWDILNWRSRFCFCHSYGKQSTQGYTVFHLWFKFYCICMSLVKTAQLLRHVIETAQGLDETQSLV